MRWLQKYLPAKRERAPRPVDRHGNELEVGQRVRVRHLSAGSKMPEITEGHIAIIHRDGLTLDQMTHMPFISLPLEGADDLWLEVQLAPQTGSAPRRENALSSFAPLMPDGRASAASTS